ncbi:MAG: hypothetical protein ACK47M_10440 [Caldilinea sp.]
MRRFICLLTLLIVAALTFAACDAPVAAPAAPGAPVVEAEAEAEEAEPEIWTMFELWEANPAERDKLMALRAVASADAVPAAVEVERPVRVAFVWPSFDLSEGWARGAIAFKARLNEFGIPFEVTEFGSTIDDHATQASHFETILAGEYDYVLVGPTELDEH